MVNRTTTCFLIYISKYESPLSPVSRFSVKQVFELRAAYVSLHDCDWLSDGIIKCLRRVDMK